MGASEVTGYVLGGILGLQPLPLGLPAPRGKQDSSAIHN